MNLRKRVHSLTQTHLLFLLALLMSCLFNQPLRANTLYIHSSDTTCGGNFPCYTSFNQAQSHASIGDTLFLMNGTYGSEGGLTVLSINKSLTLLGESQQGVILEGGTTSGFGIWVGASHVEISRLTIQHANKYGLVNESGLANGLNLSHLTIKDGQQSGIALRNIDSVSLNNIVVENNLGNGISLTSATHVTIDSITSTGNQFKVINGFTAAIGIFSTREDGSSSNIVLGEELAISEPVCIYLHPGPIDTTNILFNPPVPITDITVPLSAYAVVGVDVPIIINNPALPTEDFGGILGSDALYYFKDMEVAATCAEVAARENNGILEPYVFLYDRLTGERSLLPQVTSNPNNVIYNGSRAVEFRAKIREEKEVEGNWELSKDQGASWEVLKEGTPFHGVQTTTLTVSPFSLEMDAFQFRFVASNQWGKDTSATAEIGVPGAFMECSFAPQLYCPKDSVVTVDRFIEAQDKLFGHAEAHSNCSGVIDTLYYMDTDFRIEGRLEGEYLRTWIAKDELGNVDSCGQWITFQYDPIAVSNKEELDVLPPFSLYPNPAQGGVYIQSPDSYLWKYDVVITDLLGKARYEKKGVNPSQRQFIATQEWETGLYWVHISADIYDTKTYQLMVAH